MQTDGTLLVPDVPTVPYITGDGVGAEVTPAMQAVVDAAIRKAYGGKRRIEWKEVLAGERAFNATASWLPDETMETFQEYLVGIKGPLTTPVGGGIRSLNVALRQTLDLYVCLRPVRWYQGVQSPVKSPEKVNMCVFRENTEDIYAGIEWEAGTPEAEKFYQFLKDEMGVTKVRFPETSSFGVKPVSREGTERLVRAACQYAIDHHLPSVTLVHKGNIMKFTEGGFKKWGYELAQREFGDALADGRLVIKDCIADAFLQNTLLIPEEYSVIATLNLNGDYVSDQLAALIGIALSVSGLQMQTVFQNPLADPYLLGVSSGAGLGVALFILGAPLLGWAEFPILQSLGIVGSGWIGTAVILLGVAIISRKVKNILGVLIMGC